MSKVIREFFYRFPWLGKAQHAVVTFCAFHGINFFENSFRKVRVMSPGARALITEGKGVIYALYHGDMDLMLELPRQSNTTVLISASRDGDMIDIVTRKLGMHTARGSTARRSVAGLLGMVEAAKQGSYLAMLVDGPKGPIHEIKPGVVKLAQLTGFPIIPLGLSSRSCWWVPTWDRFNMVSLFGPVLTVYGEPLSVPAEATEEQLDQYLLELDRQMKEINIWADRCWQHSDGRRVIGFAG
jgi:lysophospholipid acyltransferase (LPLAT)-like uncharacterized protein